MLSVALGGVGRSCFTQVVSDSLITDVAIPVASILVPTAVAILLATGERRRSISDRAEERRQARLDAREERRRAAIDRVFDCLLDSLISDDELDSDAAVMKVRKLNSAIGRLHLALEGTEPGLVGWLNAEHTALGMVQTAAKLRKNRADAASDSMNRAGLLHTYVIRANELSQHILDYEAAGRPEALARKWQSDAQAYVNDPLRTGAAE